MQLKGKAETRLLQLTKTHATTKSTTRRVARQGFTRPSRSIKINVLPLFNHTPDTAVPCISNDFSLIINISSTVYTKCNKDNDKRQNKISTHPFLLADHFGDARLDFHVVRMRWGWQWEARIPWEWNQTWAVGVILRWWRRR